jgi:outer membrane protein OmpA-like peptidoglycan-associated protein
VKSQRSKVNPISEVKKWWYMYIRIGFLLLISFCSVIVIAQTSPKKLKADAERYYQNRKYPEALNLFLKYQQLHSIDKDTRLKIGHCFLENNEMSEAHQYLDGLIAENKKAAELAYFYKARALHVQHQFKDAATAYKTFLAVTAKKGHPFREASKEALLRCVNGFSLPDLSQQVIVENLGELVNDKGDDFGPVLSPNYDGRIYFSAARANNIGGLRLADGTLDEVFGKPKSDMFTCNIVDGGQWGNAHALNPLLNSAQHDVVLDFNSSGSVLYYFNGINLYSGEMFVDTFGAQPTATRPRFYSPIVPEEGDVDLYFFNDSTLLFSSDRKGGYGGKDIYICSFSNGQWTVPANLGPTINSVYDDITPFLAADGRTLYFSSNNLKSLGDLDIFRSRFNDATSSWSEPENMGVPFNSAREDAYFKLSQDGMKAYFSSSRIESMGERDIFVVYFNRSRGEQRQSNPPLFTDVLFSKKEMELESTTTTAATNSEAWTPAGVNDPTVEIENYTFSNLYFDQHEPILNKENKIILEEVIRLLKKYPSIKLELVSHTDPSGQDKFDLYFSAKRAEEVVAYLKEKGCSATSLYVRGCGINYPVAKNQTEGGASDIGRKLNRRVELVFHRTSGKPIAIDYQREKVPAFVSSDEWDNYSKLTKGLSYKIQIADIKQMYNGDLLTKLPNATIETNGTSQSYQYTVGLFRNYNSAKALQLELIRQEIYGAFVVPYIDGLRASINDAKVFATAYPDLYNYLRSVEE